MKSIRFSRRLAMAAVLCASVVAPSLVQAQDEILERSFCVFDPVGANGPLFAITKEFQPVALKRGIKLELRAYTDEKVAAEDFKAGQCDAVLLTGTRAREFNKFTGSLEAMGAVPGEEEMRLLYNTLSQPKARPSPFGALPATCHGPTGGPWPVAGRAPAANRAWGPGRGPQAPPAGISHKAAPTHTHLRVIQGVYIRASVS